MYDEVKEHTICEGDIRMLRILGLILQIEDTPESNNALDKFKSELNSLVAEHWKRGQVKTLVSDTEDGVQKIAREPKVYWFSGSKKKKGIIVFDAGYAGGSAYIYENKGFIDAEELDGYLKEHGQSVNWRILKE